MKKSIVVLMSASLALLGQESCEDQDHDQDGWTIGDGDCDDNDADVHPGAEELCDGLDNDCDGAIDNGALGKGAECAAESCLEISRAGETESGTYWIDPEGDGDAFEVLCDMETDGGGWTRFWWVAGDYGEVSQDPFGSDLSECDVDADKCLGRIPAAVDPADFMVKDIDEGFHALWTFDGSTIANAVLGAMRDQTFACIQNAGDYWNPYEHNDTSGEAWCGNGGEGGLCDSFFYQKDASCTSYRSGSGYSTELDGDNGCYAAAFKMGVGHDGYSECASPDNNFLDDGPTDSDDKHGEFYYR